MVRFLTFLALLLSTAEAGLYKDPRQFPQDCKAATQDAKGEMVGQACSTNKDCPKPSKEACAAKDPSYPMKKISQSPAMCIEGACRSVIKYEKEECDCLSGCFADSRSSVPLTCTGGQCTVPECAPCGEAPNGRRCCGNGVRGNDGKCFCVDFSAGGGCLSGGSCKDNTKCCSSGKYEGKCCTQCNDPTKPCS
ncbi:uncharacterized protein F5Z01DRAFT_691545 [Emericellopsis atlantica]|uniref:Uncharacterized protein n=1 Tax=Emericellopsis atlantica TaxID=2614577 RepID=A0A9P8CMC5_9HYPO|nr:uncharacterized protein F5Z01DRAFT_691545 [Emericellopsis atlantica]KAG9251967.1 hypothetical protein F5Z01DRAFT_691545 [Emericellopsis atlantica]